MTNLSDKINDLLYIPGSLCGITLIEESDDGFYSEYFMKIEPSVERIKISESIFNHLTICKEREKNREELVNSIVEEIKSSIN
jgi:hypothetical protein